jgi:hypothetical protein
MEPTLPDEPAVKVTPCPQVWKILNTLKPYQSAKDTVQLQCQNLTLDNPIGK